MQNFYLNAGAKIICDEKKVNEYVEKLTSYELLVDKDEYHYSISVYCDAKRDYSEVDIQVVIPKN